MSEQQSPGTLLPDSGKRTEFSTGSVRDSREGKGRYDLIPPEAMRRLALHFEAGAKKYAVRNWEKGQPLWAYLDSALRHIFQGIMCGRDDEDHAAAAVWNLMAYIATEERYVAGSLVGAEFCGELSQKHRNNLMRRIMQHADEKQLTRLEARFAQSVYTDASGCGEEKQNQADGQRDEEPPASDDNKDGVDHCQPAANAERTSACDSEMSTGPHVCDTTSGRCRACGQFVSTPLERC